MINNVLYFQEYSQELNCYNKNMVFHNSYSRFLYLNYNNIWYNDNIYDSRKFKVIVMIGIPFSGKDTFIMNNFRNLEVI